MVVIRYCPDRGGDRKGALIAHSWFWHDLDVVNLSICEQFCRTSHLSGRNQNANSRLNVLQYAETQLSIDRRFGAEAWRSAQPRRACYDSVLSPDAVAETDTFSQSLHLLMIGGKRS